MVKAGQEYYVHWDTNSKHLEFSFDAAENRMKGSQKLIAKESLFHVLKYSEYEDDCRAYVHVGLPPPSPEGTLAVTGIRTRKDSKVSGPEHVIELQATLKKSDPCPEVFYLEGIGVTRFEKEESFPGSGHIKESKVMGGNCRVTIDYPVGPITGTLAIKLLRPLNESGDKQALVASTLATIPHENSARK